MNTRYDLIIQIQMLPLGDSGKAKPAANVESTETFLIHPVAKTLDHVFDDAVTVVHDRRTDLQAVTTEEQEFGGLAPAGNTADAGDGQPTLRVARTLLDHVQG